MKLTELKKQIEEFQYFEDTGIIDISLASIIANRLSLGSTIWLVIIGPSSGGKSQILRPLSLTDQKFIHRIDDLTENTFLSGMNLGKGKGEPSLLMRIGEKGMIVISDLTVLFSKSSESRSSILSQFRMIYDGEMTKHSGTSAKPLTWKGKLGILAGSTPSIYSSFEEVADMGERFIFYRMKDYDGLKATRISMNRKLYDRDLDNKLSTLYNSYIKDVLVNGKPEELKLTEESDERILSIASLAEKIRTSTHTTWKGDVIDRIPVPAYPMRTALQLSTIARGMLMMRKHEDGSEQLTDSDLRSVEWCGYSLANEEKRACLRTLAKIKFGDAVKTQTVADEVGLATTIIGNILQNLASVGVVVRSGDGTGSLTWRIKNENEYDTIRRVENIVEVYDFDEREISDEEEDEKAKAMEMEFNKF
jgi:Mn-dependent DtxR family transcriptional regulator